ncbi:MAG: hypothetical protein ABJA64_02240 [Candidatus Saccharibacteria bacterium]
MQRIIDYVKNKSVWLYLVLYLVFTYIFIGSLGFRVETNTNPIIGIMYFIEFGIHETSHIIVSFLPPVLVAAAGSGGEILFTILVVGAALKSKAYFMAIFGSLWFMLACRSAGLYMSDARSQLLPLIGPGGEGSIHDWNFVFSQLGWLPQDHLIGGTVIVIGVIVGSLAMIAGFFIISIIAFGDKAEEASSK